MAICEFFVLRKKIKYNVTIGFVLFFLLFISTPKAFAFHCNSASGASIPIGGGTASVQVRIDPAMSAGKNVLLDLSSGQNMITCAADVTSDSTQNDDLQTSPTAPMTTISPLVSMSKATISGTDYNLPNTGALHLLRVSGKNYNGYPLSQTLPIQFWLQLSDTPGETVPIKQGDLILTLALRQTPYNVQNGIEVSQAPINYTWKFYAANDAYIITSTCTINNNQQINVAFGDIYADKLTTGSASSVTSVSQSLEYYCNSPVTQDIDIQMIATPVAGFSSKNTISTSNANIGVIMLHDGVEVPPNGSFHAKLVSGQGTDIVTFVPVKKSSSTSYSDLEGEFQASAILVMNAA